MSEFGDFFSKLVEFFVTLGEGVLEFIAQYLVVLGCFQGFILEVFLLFEFVLSFLKFFPKVVFLSNSPPGGIRALKEYKGHILD